MEDDAEDSQWTLGRVEPVRRERESAAGSTSKSAQMLGIKETRLFWSVLSSFSQGSAGDQERGQA